jgi:protein Xni
VWDHFKSEWHDHAWVEQKWGVPPDQLPDLLALMGDATDSIPGVSKVGMKTAARLLRTYGTLDGIMAGAGILKDTLGERLRKEREMLYLSRQLVQLKTDVRVGVTWNMLAWEK